MADRIAPSSMPLRLIAVFLAHWDNKASNQRLVCLPPAERVGACRRPLLMLQDVGATFGPRKVDLDGWRSTPIWADARRCLVSMTEMPYKGSTFVDVEISERGRRLLADRLATLSEAQPRTLFAEAGFPGDIDEWISVFQQKVEEISAHPGCPG